MFFIQIGLFDLNPPCLFAPSSLGWQNGQQRAKRVGVPKRDVVRFAARRMITPRCWAQRKDENAVSVQISLPQACFTPSTDAIGFWQFACRNQNQFSKMTFLSILFVIKLSNDIFVIKNIPSPALFICKFYHPVSE
jgi:hypothetical protein